MSTASNTADRKRPVSSIVGWAFAPVIWFMVFVYMIFLENGESAALVVLAVVWALPAPWLLWVSWRMPRSRALTYIAEAGALLSGLVALYVTLLEFLFGRDGPAPLALTLIFLGAAAVFIAAAVPLPGRRIAYGAAALACAVGGIRLRLLSSETTYYSGTELVTTDELFAWAFLGLPALGALLQLLWWLRHKARAA
ncbi:hypothetical protein AB0B28_10920 [Glycomyces sp. NPDC046736]|uniref:hypothetical protein n=1 Tax=Glycomyces sp. NPDC046736 TaxID=3155615 RepID=UPI0033FC3328